jgi:peptidoglycan/LPS O-acetylase OafA/YrhL
MLDWLSRFSLRRIITSNRFIPEVDGFRFVAIFIVVVSHIYLICIPKPIERGLLSSLLYRPFQNGKPGVYLFFTISGFILALPFARHHLLMGKRVNLASYFKRRLTRLEPPYILAMLLRFPMVLVYKQAALAATALHLLASLFYAHNLIYKQGSTINPPAWSLEIEIQFYILVPLLVAVFRIRSTLIRQLVLVASTLIMGIVATTMIDPDSRLALCILNYAQYFLAGFLLCDIYLCKNLPRLSPLLWDLIAALSLLWILFSRSEIYPVLLPFATISLYLGGFHGRIARAFFAAPAISIIGGMCYSIYLTHPLVLTLLQLILRRSIQRLPEAIQSLLIFAVCLPLVLLLGTIYFVLIERPCMDPTWPQRLITRRRVKVMSAIDTSKP